jgi:hypothetical protein
MYGGKDATAEFGEFHSRLAERHMEYFCVGPLVESPPSAEVPSSKRGGGGFTGLQRDSPPSAPAQQRAKAS